MPLITKLFPVREHVHESVEPEDTGSKDTQYDDFGEFENEDSDMEGSILNRPRPKKVPKPPAIPQRSEKRASRILENLTSELKSLDGSTPHKDLEQQSIVSDPHDFYLSSEEDASENADDYEESIIEFDDDRAPLSRASSRRSQEDTAVVISFTLVGKPQIVDIFCSHQPVSQNRRSLSSDNMPHRPTTFRFNSSIPRPSTSSASSSSLYQPSSVVAPPRKSSKTSGLTNLIIKHTFLSTDPFPTSETQEFFVSPTLPSHDTPKTPTSSTQASWKGGLSRTFSMAKRPSMSKRSSMPKISLAYTAGVVARQSSSSLATPVSATKELTPTLAARKDSMSATRGEEEKNVRGEQRDSGGPVRYEDIMRNVIKAPPPAPLSPRGVKGRTSMLGLGKRSQKGRA